MHLCCKYERCCDGLVKLIYASTVPSLWLGILVFCHLAQRLSYVNAPIKVTVTDIEKALQVKTYSDLCEKLSCHYHHWLEVFDCKKTDALSLHCDSKINHQIKLMPDK